MCGIVGLIGTPDAAREAFLGLTTLQHRGQDAAGILTFDGDGFHRVKNLGLVESVFNRDNMQSLTGNIAIGHSRYATIGRGDLVDVQPFLLNYPYGIGLVHNGNIVNCSQLAKDLRKQNRRHLLTSSDSEVVLNLLAEGLAHAPAQSTDGAEADPKQMFENICSAVGDIFKRVNGSYSIVTLVADQGLLAFRDPNGIRPLVWGRRVAKRSEDRALGLASGEAHMVASESVALSFLGYEIVRDIQPGEVLFIDMQGGVHTRVLEGREPRHCMFEWVYFASPESVIDGVPVYGSRINLGRALAKLVQERIRDEIRERRIEADIVVPVPETSRIAAIALAEDIGIPYREVLIKNRYIKRTFILDSQEKRQKAVNLKLSPVRSEIAGKRVLLVDDSIVRGTTSRKIIELVRQAGAKKVYFVSTCPPIKHPCYYGIDFPMEGELIASGRSPEEIEKELGADAVIYQDLEGLRESIIAAMTTQNAFPDARGALKPPFKPCMACLDGKYPTDVSAGSGFAAARAVDRTQSGDRRA
jgi:amidophosphoribosyltransferase